MSDPDTDAATAALNITDDGPAARAPRFSVIINIYNGEDFLRETIDSVLAQTFTDYELILWDDCSTDRSAEIAASYSDPRIRYFCLPERLSVALARAGAVDEARGEWLAFLDQDDIWLPHKLAAQNELIEQQGNRRLGLVYGRTIRFDENGRRSVFDDWHGRNRLPEGDIFLQLLRRPSFIAWSSTVIRHSAFIAECGVPSYVSYCPDYYYCVVICRRFLAACVQEPCCLYRVHQTNMSHVYRKEIHEEALHIIENAAEWPAQRRLLRNRQRVHQTWIGVEEMRVRHTMGRGLLRILLKGSVPYLTFRPLLTLSRRIRHGASFR